MHRIAILALLAALASGEPGALGLAKLKDRGERQLLTSGSHWQLLGGGYQLTADSAVDPAGNVYLSDARRNRILKVDLEGKISTWKEPSHGSHGVGFGPDGRLYAGQHDRKRIVAFSSDGTESVITEGVQTHHFTVTSRNRIYFCVAPAHQVWLMDAAGNRRVVFDKINWPRGVHASPDESHLVVNDPPTRWVWSFQIQADGSLLKGKLFYHLETQESKNESDPGGMVFDAKGRLYVATEIGVQVFDRRGRVTAILAPPGTEGLTNVFFGGEDRQWLYVTDGDKIYRRRSIHQGVGPAR